MSIQNYNALNVYRQVEVDAGVLAASPHKLILLLFDGAIQAIAKARFHMERREIAAKGEAVSKGISIIGGLNGCLDKKAGGPIAENLGALYEYMNHRLMQANVKNDIGGLDEVTKLLTDLRGAWDAIGRTEQQRPLDGFSEQPPQRSALSYGKA
jgi:flagellar protein FliS